MFQSDQMSFLGNKTTKLLRFACIQYRGHRVSVTGHIHRWDGQFPFLQFSAHQSSIPGRLRASLVATHRALPSSLVSRVSILLSRAVRVPLIPARDSTTSPVIDIIASSSSFVLL